MSTSVFRAGGTWPESRPSYPAAGSACSESRLQTVCVRHPAPPEGGTPNGLPNSMTIPWWSRPVSTWRRLRLKSDDAYIQGAGGRTVRDGNGLRRSDQSRRRFARGIQQIRPTIENKSSWFHFLPANSSVRRGGHREDFHRTHQLLALRILPPAPHRLGIALHLCGNLWSRSLNDTDEVPPLGGIYTRGQHQAGAHHIATYPECHR